MSEDVDTIEVADNRAAGAFELRDAGRLIGIARYAVVPASGAQPERVVFFHTEVSQAYEGQGLAGRLATEALDQTVAGGRTIVALCPYIKVFPQAARHRLCRARLPTAAHRSRGRRPDRRRLTPAVRPQVSLRASGESAAEVVAGLHRLEHRRRAVLVDGVTTDVDGGVDDEADRVGEVPG